MGPGPPVIFTSSRKIQIVAETSVLIINPSVSLPLFALCSYRGKYQGEYREIIIVYDPVARHLGPYLLYPYQIITEPTLSVASVTFCQWKCAVGLLFFRLGMSFVGENGLREMKVEFCVMFFGKVIGVQRSAIFRWECGGFFISVEQCRFVLFRKWGFVVAFNVCRRKVEKWSVFEQMRASSERLGTQSVKATLPTNIVRNVVSGTSVRLVCLLINLRSLFYRPSGIHCTAREYSARIVNVVTKEQRLKRKC